MNKYISLTADELRTLDRVLNEIDVKDIFLHMKHDKVAKHNTNLSNILTKIKDVLYG